MVVAAWATACPTKNTSVRSQQTPLMATHGVSWAAKGGRAVAPAVPGGRMVVDMDGDTSYAQSGLSAWYAQSGLSEDLSIHGVLTAGMPLALSTWSGRTGLSELPLLAALTNWRDGASRVQLVALRP